GSYGWGDGEWMRNWEDTCKGDGANLVCESVICNDAPDDDALEACKKLGASLA
ncbi:MAG: flavodoxin, partial [Ruminococcus bromii]